MIYTIVLHRVSLSSRSHIYIYIFFFKELADRFHDLPSAIWKLQRFDGVIWSMSKGLRTRITNGVNPSLRVENQVPSSSSQAETTNTPIPLFALFEL
jgi:hypothetical protein